jgi:hypothetical protein
MSRVPSNRAAAVKIVCISIEWISFAARSSTGEIFSVQAMRVAIKLFSDIGRKKLKLEGVHFELRRLAPFQSVQALERFCLSDTSELQLE